MRVHSLSPAEWGKSLAIGIGVAILTGGIMFMGLKTGISPLPKPLGLAFAETLLGTSVPLPVGLLFHVAWVTFFSVVYVVLFRDALTFMRAFWLAFALWILTLVFFFPLVGWGFLGLAVTPRLIIAAAVAHLLFAVFLWGLCRMSFSQQESIEEGSHGHPAQ
ncbi:hypothetical protein [Ensifer sp. LCM 4579]|uniref:hypothetical protein n=1 Tax=Ensifer sp. LCM 4579 TaxID=1848292 RepID=UPI0008DA8C6A|nr:hypothetical protein [Ensifer sp. LCM 4579]OHV79594.1 hypothetical protein LCM4579_03300 [Ensifer sp. LCM 4579]